MSADDLACKRCPFFGPDTFRIQLSYQGMNRFELKISFEDPADCLRLGVIYPQGMGAGLRQIIAKERRTLRVSRPMLEVMLKDWVTLTKLTS